MKKGEVMKNKIGNKFFLHILLVICIIFGMSSVNSETFAGEWGEWSPWQDDPVVASNTREVQTQQVIDSYNMESYVYSDDTSPSWRGYWPNPTNRTLRASLYLNLGKILG